ncbi:MAG: hypothetical protein R3F54_09590 [Alphaproteobacteria bacterium]
MKATVAQSVRAGGADPERIYVDRGYRGHDYDGKARVIVAGQKRGPTPTMRREQKRRNGPVAVIGDAINALAAACGYNLRRILYAIRRLCALVILMLTAGMAKSDTWSTPTCRLTSTAQRILHARP